jgi:hypothetical protein
MKFVPQWFFRSTRAYRRFSQACDGFKVKLTGAKPAPWAAAAQPFLDKADERLAAQDLDGAWSLLQEGMRKEIAALHDPELSNREQILRCEAAKVRSEWRKCAVDHLMKEGQPEDGRSSRLETSQWLLDDYYQNQYYKNGLLQGQLRNLVFISLIALLALLTLIGWTGTDLTKWPDWDWKTLLLVLLFGVLGASFSATRKITDDSGKSKIPEMAASFSITVARTVLGATPALAAYAFLRSGMLTVGSSGANKTPMPVVLAISFAAGFSERLVLGVLESLDNKTGGKPDNKASGKTSGAAPQP